MKNCESIILEYLPTLIGIITIVVNIAIAIYNVGKNRIIYDVEEIHVDRTKGDLTKVKDKLNARQYTILNVFQDNDRKVSLYTLGKVRK